MFEKRPIWGLIVGLNVCILIWLISVQGPVMFDVGTSAISSGSSSMINGAAVGVVKTGGEGREEEGDGGRYNIPVQSNMYIDKRPTAISILTTLNVSSNNSNNNLKTIILPTTKASDLSSDMQSLTSSPGTGILNLKTKPTPPSSTLLTAASSALPEEDFSQLIDLHNFQLLIPQPVCGNHIEALILIHSAPKNYEKRQVIRETWGSISHHIADSPLRVLFLLGAVNSVHLQKNLEMENDANRDIVQGSFIDDYRNMTYKHVMAFKWFLYNCPQAQILIKVDDDVYVNTPQLIKYLKQQQLRQQQQQEEETNFNEINNPTIVTTAAAEAEAEAAAATIVATTETTRSIFRSLNIFSSLTTLASSPSTAFNASNELFNHPQNLLFCQKIVGSLVKRSYRSKWRVSFKEYSGRYYPPYCPGFAIIYSPDIILRLYTAAQNYKYFWIDDVHITGVLAQQTNTTITTSSHYVLCSDECDQRLTGKTDLSEMEFLFAWRSISAQKIKLLWNLQMMSIHTLDDLYYKKIVQNDLLYKKKQQKQQHLHQRYQQQQTQFNNIDENLVFNKISSLYSYTSSNGSR